VTQAPLQRRVRWFAHGLAMGAVFTSSTSWAACTVSATGLPFGAYNPANASATDAVGTVTVNCTVLVALNMSWTVTMSKGASSTYSPRFLANGAAHLSYNIYTTTARATVWGDGSGGTGFISDSQFLVIGTTVSHYTMYGRIPALQDVNAGAYSDSIVVTVTY
jgi:spore coat protein U-like protein